MKPGQGFAYFRWHAMKWYGQGWCNGVSQYCGVLWKYKK